MNEINTENSVWLLQWFKHRIQKNRNVIALFIGDTGSGKSLSSIRLAVRASCLLCTSCIFPLIVAVPAP